MTERLTTRLMHDSLNTVTYWELPSAGGIDFSDSRVGRASCPSFEGSQDACPALCLGVFVVHSVFFAGTHTDFKGLVTEVSILRKLAGLGC